MEAPRVIPGAHSSPINSADRPPANCILRIDTPCLLNPTVPPSPARAVSGLANANSIERSLGWRGGQEGVHDFKRTGLASFVRPRPEMADAICARSVTPLITR